MKELIGKKVNKVFLDSKSQHWIKFETDHGDFHYYADGDCCSESYFAEILGIENLKNYQVLDVETMFLGATGGTRQDVDKIYGLRLLLGYDWCDYQNCALVIFRNSSNGYYGGSCDYVDLEHERYGENNKKNVSSVKWMELINDYRE